MESKNKKQTKKNNTENKSESGLFPDNAYLVPIRKKIRNLRKKQKNIQEIEKKIKEKKEINEDQRNALKTKDEVEEKLKEWLKIENQMVEVAQKEAQPVAQIDPNLQTFVSLLHTSTFYSDSSPSGIGNRNEFLEFQKERQNSGAKVSVNHITHFDQIQNFVSHVLFMRTGADIQQSTQKTIEEVQKVVQGSDSEIKTDLTPDDLNGISYQTIRDTLNEILEVGQNIPQQPAQIPIDDSILPPELAVYEEEYPEDQPEPEQPFEPQGGSDQKRGAHRGKRGSNRGGSFRGNRGKGNPRGDRGGNRGNFRGGQGKRGNAQYQQKQPNNAPQQE